MIVFSYQKSAILTRFFRVKCFEFPATTGYVKCPLHYYIRKSKLSISSVLPRQSSFMSISFGNILPSCQTLYLSIVSFSSGCQDGEFRWNQIKIKSMKIVNILKWCNSLLCLLRSTVISNMCSLTYFRVSTSTINTTGKLGVLKLSLRMCTWDC